MKKMTNMHRWLWTAAAALLILQFHLADVRAQTSVTCIGAERIAEQPIPEARQNAIADCLMHAADQAVMEMYSRDAVIRQFKAVSPAVTENTEDLIEKYRILAEAISGKYYRVILNVTVSASKLKARLADLAMGEAETSEKPLPRLYAVMQEKIAADPEHPDAAPPGASPDPVSRALDALIKEMQKNGFDVVGGESIFVQPDAPFVDVLHEAETFREAAEQGAELFILGQAVAGKSMNTMGSDVRSFNAAATCRVVRLDTSEIIVESVQSAAVVHSDDAAGVTEVLAAAGAAAGRDLSEKIPDAWGKSAKPPIRLIVGGRNFFGNFIMFRKALHRIEGVGAITMEEMKPDRAAALVPFSGDARELADALMKQSFESFSIAIREVTRHSLTIELKPGG